jgi:hypothetical protein
MKFDALPDPTEVSAVGSAPNSATSPRRGAIPVGLNVSF